MNQDEKKKLIDMSFEMVNKTIKALYEETNHECYLNDCQVNMLKDLIKTLAYLSEIK